MPKGGRYGDMVARGVRELIGPTAATTTALKAVPTDHPSRVDGALTCVLAGGGAIYVFDADSSASAGAGVLVPDSGSGRWFLASGAYEGSLQSQKFVPVPITQFVLAANGAPLIVFADAVADGLDFSEGMSYRFNVASTTKIGTTIPIPPDIDDASDLVVHIMASRVGGADTDAVIDMEAFFQTAGAAHDADADAGGSTSALASATTVVDEKTVTIDAADVPAAPCALSLTLVPDAALDADDLRIHAVWLEYTGTIAA